MKKKKKISTERIISVCAVILFFAAWYLVTALELVDPKLIPTPKATWDSFVEVLTQGYKGHTLLQHLGTSMERLLKAFLLSVVTAVPLGLLSGFSSKIKAFVEPFIEFYRPLPPLAYYTLLTLALGIGNSSKIALLFLACFAPIYVACVSAVARIKEDYINAAYTVGGNPDAGVLECDFTFLCSRNLCRIKNCYRRSIFHTGSRRNGSRIFRYRLDGC